MKECIIISNTCSNEYYKYLQSIKYSEKLSPSQKYFHMLIEGLNAIEDCKVKCVSLRSIDISNSRIQKLDRFDEVENGVCFTYIPVISRKIIKNIYNIIGGYRTTKKLLIGKNVEDAILIFDPLSYDISLGALLASKRFKKCGLVTDIPYYMAQIHKEYKVSAIKQKIRVCLMNFVLNRFDMFCFLTDSMNIINKKNKPHLIVEGMVYLRKQLQISHASNNTVLYAGGLYEQYGIRMLIEAAKKIEINNFEIHFYGEGPAVELIKSAEKDYPNIKYMGVLSLDEIIEVEKSAKILINPRPSKEKFTEFSFPSKTLEYLSTGRPVITTRLKGIPEDYFDYLIPIEIETVDGIKNTIESCLSKPDDELDEIGFCGLKYVMKNKNNEVQAAKLWKFMMSEIKKKG